MNIADAAAVAAARQQPIGVTGQSLDLKPGGPIARRPWRKHVHPPIGLATFSESDMAVMCHWRGFGIMG
jgi:hypothetical protein